jgi:hypothetical protein
MKRFAFVLCAGLACAAVAAPASAFTPLNASWMVTYYIDPLGGQGATHCINFNKTGESSGVIVGKWFATTLKGWHGEWSQKGQHFQWHGFYGKTATYDVGDFVNVNIAAEASAAAFALNPNGRVVTLDTATATLVQVRTCPKAQVQTGLSPFRLR